MNDNKNMGALNKKEKMDQTNKKIMILVIIILVVIAGVFVIIRTMENAAIEGKKADIETIIKEGQTKIIYVMNSDESKCKKCDEIQKYLEDQKINYLTYDVSEYSEKEYKKMLQTVSINPSDFGYPAVIYIRDGKLYSNVINLTDTKPLETFIKDYDLTKIK